MKMMMTNQMNPAAMLIHKIGQSEEQRKSLGRPRKQKQRR
jgi:hypothetical protein